MKNIYVSPEIEITAISTEDVVMISALDVKESGSLTEIGWGSIK